jgi:hypothetical protein
MKNEFIFVESREEGWECLGYYAPDESYSETDQHPLGAIRPWLVKRNMMGLIFDAEGVFTNANGDEDHSIVFMDVQASNTTAAVEIRMTWF